MTGTLYLVPAPLDFGCATQSSLSESMPQHTLSRAAGLRHWICENAKSTRAYLKRVGESHPLCAPIQEMQLQELRAKSIKKATTKGALTPSPCWPPPCKGMTSAW